MLNFLFDGFSFPIEEALTDSDINLLHLKHEIINFIKYGDENKLMTVKISIF